jgi:hypothetical protein
MVEVFQTFFSDSVGGAYARTDYLDDCLGYRYARTGYLDDPAQVRYARTDYLDDCPRYRYARTGYLADCRQSGPARPQMHLCSSRLPGTTDITCTGICKGTYTYVAVLDL